MNKTLEALQKKANLAITQAYNYGVAEGFKEHNNTVWHYAQLPKDDEDILIEHPDGYTVGWYGNAFHNEEGLVIEHPQRWAYIKDLIPKE